MTLHKNNVAKWLEIAAHIGIVVGLLLVAFQIAQEDEIAQTDVNGQIFSDITAHYEKLAGENPAKSLARAMDDPQTLTTEDHVVLFNLYMAEFSKAMRQESMPGYKIPRSSIVRWTALTSNPYGYAWWRTFGKDLSPFVPQLYAGVEPVLEQIGPLHALQAAKGTQAIHELVLKLNKPQ